MELKIDKDVKQFMADIKKRMPGNHHLISYSDKTQTHRTREAAAVDRGKWVLAK